MTDPRNIAHDKKVHHDKKNAGEEIAPGSEHAPQPGKKPHIETHDDEVAVEDAVETEVKVAVDPEAAKNESRK